LQSGQTLVAVNYFTACVTSPEDKRKRQLSYIEALVHHSSINVIKGKFLETDFQCRHCAKTWKKREEKMTDVAIATELLIGAVRNEYDVAILVSGDSDLVPPVQALKSQFGHKRIFARFPPKRKSFELQSSCHGWGNISESDLRVSQLPNEVKKLDGYTLKRPSSWR
jgi:uncharacterized LabA/DUF88 family protein